LEVDDLAQREAVILSLQNDYSLRKALSVCLLLLLLAHLTIHRVAALDTPEQVAIRLAMELDGDGSIHRIQPGEGKLLHHIFVKVVLGEGVADVLREEEVVSLYHYDLGKVGKDHQSQSI
jgi:hypothetical protein